MRTAMRPRYYCDHCNKGNGSPSAMRRHESGCTKNPNRVCRMCALVEEMGGPAQRPMTELTAVLTASGFKAMCEAANDCPACILAVLRPLNSAGDWETPPGVAGPEDGRQEWSYRQAKDQWWKEYNDECARHDHPY
jgi:hypothetical protein